jgi:hypothetical protein
VLIAAEGLSNEAIGECVGAVAVTVTTWRRRFAAGCAVDWVES